MIVKHGDPADDCRVMYVVGVCACVCCLQCVSVRCCIHRTGFGRISGLLSSHPLPHRILRAVRSVFSFIICKYADVHEHVGLRLRTNVLDDRWNLAMLPMIAELCTLSVIHTCPHAHTRGERLGTGGGGGERERARTRICTTRMRMHTHVRTHVRTPTHPHTHTRARTHTHKRVGITATISHSLSHALSPFAQVIVSDCSKALPVLNDVLGILQGTAGGDAPMMECDGSPHNNGGNVSTHTHTPPLHLYGNLTPTVLYTCACHYCSFVRFTQR